VPVGCSEAARRARRFAPVLLLTTRAWPHLGFVRPGLGTPDLRHGELLAEQGSNETDVSTQSRMALLGRDGVVGGDGVAHGVPSVGRVTRPLRHGRIVPTATGGLVPMSPRGLVDPGRLGHLPVRPVGGASLIDSRRELRPSGSGVSARSIGDGHLDRSDGHDLG